SRTVPLGVAQVRPSTGSGRPDAGSERADVAEEAATGYAALGGLTVQLRRSLDYYRAQFGGATIDDLILCGGGIGVPDIAETLSGELELSAAPAAPFAGLLIPSDLQEATSGQSGAQMTVAVGLALRGMV
ncbi:MAG: type IV pilus biogenesis protein PilM, partial [Burkholderiales bacterium]